MHRADGDLAVEEARVLDAVLVNGPAHPELQFSPSMVNHTSLKLSQKNVQINSCEGLFNEEKREWRQHFRPHPSDIPGSEPVTTLTSEGTQGIGLRG